MSYNMLLDSGSEISDKVGKLNISGNITPALWYKTVTRENGKPYLLAIAILSDIVYWYRPSEIRDESSGQLIGWRKKFSGDMLQKTYQQYADFFGESKRSVKAAMDRLEELGIIKKIFRDEVRGGQLITNLMYIYLDADMLYNITFIDIEYQEKVCDAPCQHNSLEKEEKETPSDEESNSEYNESHSAFAELDSNINMADEENQIPNIKDKQRKNQKNSGNGHSVYGVVQNNVPPHTKFCTTLLQNNVSPPTKFCSYTENTIKNTNENTINQSVSRLKHVKAEDATDMIDNEALIEQLKANLEYDLHINSGSTDARLFNDAYMTMCDVILAGTGSTFIINGAVHTWEDVKRRMLSLDYAHVMYAVHKVSKVPESNVANLRNYLISALYNSINTMNISISQSVKEHWGYD